MEAAQIEAEVRRKATRTRRVGPLPGVNRKLAELAAEAVQIAIKEDHRHASEHTRIKALCEMVLAGNFSRMLKHSTLLSPEDKEFLRGLGYL